MSDERLNLRPNFQKGREEFETKWGYLYNTDCDICKSENICTRECKHRVICNLYVIRTDEGIVKMEKINVTAKLPIRGTSGSAGYDLAATQSVVVPGKVCWYQ